MAVVLDVVSWSWWSANQSTQRCYPAHDNFLSHFANAPKMYDSSVDWSSIGVIKEAIHSPPHAAGSWRQNYADMTSSPTTWSATHPAANHLGFFLPTDAHKFQQRTNHSNHEDFCRLDPCLRGIHCHRLPIHTLHPTLKQAIHPTVRIHSFRVHQGVMGHLQKQGEEGEGRTNEEELGTCWTQGVPISFVPIFPGGVGEGRDHAFVARGEC